MAVFRWTFWRGWSAKHKIRGAMTDQQLANELLGLCKRLLVESMTKSSAISALLALHLKLPDGRNLNTDVLKTVMEDSRTAAELAVSEPFTQLEQVLAAGSDPGPALRELLDRLG